MVWHASMPASPPGLAEQLEKKLAGNMDFNGSLNVRGTQFLEQLSCCVFRGIHHRGVQGNL